MAKFKEMPVSYDPETPINHPAFKHTHMARQLKARRESTLKRIDPLYILGAIFLVGVIVSIAWPH